MECFLPSRKVVHSPSEEDRKKTTSRLTGKRQTTPLPPAPPLPLHLHLGVHEFGLHPSALLLIVAHGGTVEEVGEVRDCVGRDDCGDGR